jgi:quercetin dioxygenase-like cupin family protein
MAVIHRFIGSGNNYHWEEIQPQSYSEADISGVFKHVLIGPEDGAPNFIIRYFKVEPGGFSRLESHPQEHGILILHGSAQIQLKDEITSLGPLDTVFIPGGEVHQLKNTSDDKLGFICVIPANTL